MQFQVPQFIETEAKIFGPLTVKQLIYCAVAGAILAVLFFALNFILWLPIAAVIGGATLGFAFFKYNGRPMPELLKSVFQYYWNPRFYLWQREEPKAQTVKIPKIPSASALAGGGGGLKGLVFRLTTSTQNITKREIGVNFSSLLSKLPHGTREQFETLRKSTGEREEVRRIDYR